MKKLIFTLFMVILISCGFSVLSEYSFTQSVGTYTELTTPTLLHDVNIDDAQSAVTDIGFTFVYDDVPYTTFKASSNGFITFNPTSTTSQSNLLATQLLIVAGLWDDLKTDATNSSVSYQLTGTAPNRSLKVQWQNLKWYYSYTPVNLINFQIILNETSNTIQYIYGTMGTEPGTSATASIGITGAVAGNYISITPADPTATYSTTTAFAAINGTHVPFLTGKMYTFAPPVAVPNDLQALSIGGNLTPTAGSASSYTVSIRNRGSAAQSNYTVNIKSGETVLASIAGPAIAAGAVMPVQVNWTPAATGPVALTGNVSLAGDQNPSNDNTAPINVTVQAAGTTAVTIGDGSQTARMPVDMFYKNSVFETVFPAAEITAGGVISAVAFYNSFTSTELATGKPTKVWLGETTQTDLSAGWIPSTQLTLVFDGMVNYPSGQNTITIPFTVPYGYSGTNLVMMVQRPMDTIYFDSTDLFLCQTVGTTRTRNSFDDTTVFDPENPSTTDVTISGQFPKTTFFFSGALPANDMAAIGISGNQTPTQGTANNYVVTIRNTGTDTQTTYSVKLMSGTTELASVAGPTLATATSATVTIPWTPSATGLMSIFGKVVLTGDANAMNDQTAALNVEVQAAGSMLITVGTGTESIRMPVDMYYKNSLFETIILGTEINMGGLITGIKLYNNFTTATLMQKPTKIWMCATQLADLSAGWIPSTDMQLVFDGNVDYPGGQNTISITFTQPFAYGGTNLAIMFQRPMDIAYFSSSDYFKGQTIGTSRSRNSYDDTTVFDPASPSTTDVTVSGQFPKISFNIAQGGTEPTFGVSPAEKNFGTLLLNSTASQTFSVYNSGGGNLIINNIAITGSPFFTLQNVPTLPATLTLGQFVTFTAQYSPTAAGTHTATVNVTDNLGRTYSYGVSRASSDAGRSVHPVLLSGTCLDPTITAPPYVQNFDGITAPNLPIDWRKVVVSTAGNVTTSTTTPHSAPNCVYLTNSSDAAAGLYLVSPPVANNIPIVTMRVKFWAKGGANYTLGVGVIADPADAATYSEVSSVTLTAAWAEYVVGFQTYAGQGHHIAFKHGLGATYRSIYIDDVTIEVTPQNDLAALSIIGNSTPTVGSPTPYTVNVFNWGTNAQSNYTVKLYNGDNLELASVTGPQIEGGMAAQVVVNWSPATPGAGTIYGKVVLTGDQNSLNDQTTPITLNVQPEGTFMVTIGDGVTTQRQPMGIYYGYERDASLYTQAQMGIMGVVTGVQWYCATSNAGAVPYRILMKTTPETALTAMPWATMIENAIVVAEGTQTFSETGWVYLPFTTPYPYVGENLIVMVETSYGGGGATSYPYFRYTTGTAGSHQYWYADTNPPTVNGTINANLPNIGLSLVAGGTEPAFNVSPTSFTYNQIFINTFTNKTFNITNIGGGTNPLIINSITISGSPMFSLQSLPTLPVSLNSFQSTNFVAKYNPTTPGTHTATITITDNLGRSYNYSTSRSNGNSRTQHLVQLSGSSIDPVIYTPPYTQNFDLVTTPALPIDWSKIVQSTSAANVTSYTTTPHSAPNCVYLTNSADAAASLFLIAPPIANNIPLVTMRVKFWAKGGTNYTLGVGVIADPADAATYTEVSSQTLTSAWAEYVVSFQTYSGQGRYMAFKHGLGATYRSIYIDDVTIEVTPQNDLAAVSLNGNITPTVGVATTYTVGIFNWGMNPQSNYSVKLYNGDNLELASVAGPQIEPGLAGQVEINWTPATAGDLNIYGKVILTGDQNNLNDQTPNFNVSVQQAGTIVVTIGDGTSTQRQPMGILYGFERDASLFVNDAIGVMGAISGIRWYCGTTATAAVPYKIYLKTTTETALTATPWATMLQEATLMKEGTYTFSQTGWVFFSFDTPFIYPGGNLIVMVETYYGGGGTTSPAFRYTAGPTGCHQYWYADTTAPAGNGYLNVNRPNIGISLSSIGTEPAFGVSPTTHNFGQVFLNTVNNKTINVINVGGGTNPLIINSIAITGSPMVTLQNLPTLPVSLNSFQTTSFIARYTPTAVGTHTATITITDNLGRSFSINEARTSRDNRTAHPVQIEGTCIDPTIYTPPYAQNFDTVTAPALPIDWSALVQSSVTTGYVRTVTTTPHTPPNCVALNNSTDTSAQVMLVSPPIATTIPINTMRIKFWAKATAGYTLGVGIQSSPTSAATYTEVSSVTLTAAWAEYVVGFQTYTGQGNYIALKHGLGGSSRTLYVDDVTIEVTPQNDLAPLSIVGNITPSVGMTTNYTVDVFNWGTNPQSTYNVKLFKEGDIEIASVAGPALNPGLSIPVTVPWTPAEQGQTFIYAKVVLTGDQNPLNDQTANLNVSVQAAGTMLISVGEGTTTQRQPFAILYGYERDASLITSAQIGSIGSITGLQWYCSTTATAAVPYKIYIKPTTATALTATPWATMVADAQLVKEGTVTFSQTGWQAFTLPTPYLHLTESNLIIMVETFYGGGGTTSPAFRYTAGPTGCHQYWYADTNPPTTNGTVNVNRPNIGIFMIPGGVGHLTGNVYGANNTPLNNATIQIVNGGQAITDAQGHYMIQNVIAGTYDVTASRFGYTSQTLSVIIPEDITVTQNFTLAQMPTVNVTGTIIGSDLPGVGINGATISLTGMENYSATTNASGFFTISGVYANQSYSYQASAVGYQNATGNVNVGATDHSMGNMTVNEIAYTPRGVTAAQNTAHTEVTVNWIAPDPNAVDITQSFENDVFPPTDWTRTITNNGPANASGVYPTWSRFGTVTSSTDIATPPDGSWQCGFWWDYNHQDEWLITPQFNCPQGAYLTFGTFVYRGSTNGDHYYVKVTNNNGLDWTVLWDASTLTGGLNNYQIPVQIDLSAYAGQQVKIAWHADDPNTTNDGMWYNWFIDNVVISNTVMTVRFREDELVSRSASGKQTSLQNIVTDIPMSRSAERLTLSQDRITQPMSSRSIERTHGRSLQGYRVWRLSQGQEQNESTWTSLTPQMITDLTVTDTGWAALAPGTYKWAVKAIYTGGVASLGAFSNALPKVQEPQGTLVGQVKNSSNIPIMGAIVRAGAFSATTSANGNYSLTLNAGTYTVTCEATNYNTITQLNVVINANMPTTQNFIMITTGSSDVVEVTATTLKGNYPNPFNPETTINYDVKAASQVKIEIYNTKGQLIRTLVNGQQAKGSYHVVWNGKDNNGNSVASGVYHYRMQAGDYKAERMMMLMK